MKALVTGPRGFVGARIMSEMENAIPAPSLRSCSDDDIRRLVETVQPDVIIHTAAISDIPTCEKDPDASRRANIDIPVCLVRTGRKCVIFSSDQVYSGCAGEGPYAEDDVSPANVYARHKLEMEQRTLDICPDTVLLRATWMYDMPMYGVPNRGNFLMLMLRNADAAFSSGDYRAITYVREVARLIRQATVLPGGVYNYGSENDLSMLDTALWLKDKLSLPIRISDRPAHHNLWMDCSKAKSHAICFPNTIEGLKKCIVDYSL